MGLADIMSVALRNKDRDRSGSRRDRRGWVVDVIDHIEVVGVGALTALENVFPPIPSEIILPFAGFRAPAVT